MSAVQLVLFDFVWVEDCNDEGECLIGVVCNGWNGSREWLEIGVVSSPGVVEFLRLFQEAYGG
jgi:hypothetical protein